MSKETTKIYKISFTGKDDTILRKFNSLKRKTEFFADRSISNTKFLKMMMDKFESKETTSKKKKTCL